MAQTPTTSMATSASGNGNQSISALFYCFVSVGVVDHIVQDNAAITVRGFVDFNTSAQAGDDNWHLVLYAHGHVVIKAVVALMNNLVDRKRCRRFVWIRCVVSIQGLSDFNQPLF